MAKKKKKDPVSLWETYRDALKRGTTAVQASNSQTVANAFYTNTIQPYQQQIVDKWFDAWDKPKEYLAMDDNMRNIVTLILAGMARANGGQVAIGQADLGEVGDRIHLEADSVTGLIVITLLPDYVSVGIDPELEPKIQWDPTPMTTTTTNTTYKATGPYKLMINGIEQPGTFVNDSANSLEWRAPK